MIFKKKGKGSNDVLAIVGFFVFLNVAYEGFSLGILFGQGPVIGDGGFYPDLPGFAEDLGKQAKIFHEFLFVIGNFCIGGDVQCSRSMHRSAIPNVDTRIDDILFSRTGKFFVGLGEKLNFQIWKQIGEVLLNLPDGLIVFNRYFHNSKINQVMKVVERWYGMPITSNDPS